MRNWVWGSLDHQQVRIFFEQDGNTPINISVQIGEVSFDFDKFSPLQQEKLLREIDRNNCDVI